MIMKPSTCHPSVIASMTTVFFQTQLLLYKVGVPWNRGIGGPKTGQTVPGSGIVPFSKYALMYFIVQREGPESEVCYKTIDCIKI